ncbi:hypothetical protein IHN63_00515 [Deinococcus sp. 6YEL10]|uniref:hypothetical protein n=1 Tax=Deinococcus sp. 6YEL10 TaxID=2745870 RepID=UPI001E2942E1|nr:hypothetical protein [Deinococcus sp. 6YEL10]MCD0159782.1 hypothetical protein [Deinococcus sp. 6YEL10]
MQKSGVNITEKLTTGGPQLTGGFPLILVGQSERGPDGLSEPLSRLDEFESTYGRVPVAGSYVNDAVYLYTSQEDSNTQPGNFYYVRVTPSGYVLAESTVKALVSGGAVGTTDALRFRATGKGKWGAKVRTVLTPSTAGDSGRVNVTIKLYDAETGGNVVATEEYENLYFRPGNRQNPKFIENVINATSKLARVTVLADAQHGLDLAAGAERPLINATADSGTVTRDDIKAALDLALPKIKGVGFLYVPDAYNVPDTSGANPTFGAVVQDLELLGAVHGKLVVLDALESDTLTQGTTKVTALAGRKAAMVNVRWGYSAYRQSVAVPLSAAWIGLYSARANNPSMGLHYPASNLPLRGVVGLKALPNLKLDEARAANVNVFVDLDGGGYGLHGLWTPDKDADGFRQVTRRLIWWDIQLAVRTAVSGMIQNNPINPYTLKLIDQRVIVLLKSRATRGMLVGRGGSAASRGNGYDFVFDTSNQVELNKGNLAAVLTVRDSATLEELQVTMSNYNDYLD